MDVEARLNRLERQGRFYRNILAVAAILILATITYGATMPVPKVFKADIIEVRRIKVKEILKAGAIRAEVIEVKPKSGKGMVAIYLTSYGGGDDCNQE